MESRVVENVYVKCYISSMAKEELQKSFGILQYIDDPNIWKHWLMDGTPKPHEAAALLPSWLASFETSIPEHRINFWTLRAAMFYNNVRWANHLVRGEWGERAEFVDWNGFLSKIGGIPKDTGLLFFPGKFRTLPTPTQVETISFELKDRKDGGIVSALVFEPRENVTALEGDKLVFDDKIRIWAYSQLPVDIITRFPIIQEGEDVSQFYNDKYNKIRGTKVGYVGVGVGVSDHRDKITRFCQEIGIEIVDTTIEVHKEKYGPLSIGDTTDFDKLSSKSDLANELILKYLQHMGQI